MIEGLESGLRASDLAGCRYRLVQKMRFPDQPRTHQAEARAERHEAARAVVMDKLPAKADNKRQRFRRIDLGPLPVEDPWERSLATLEALAGGYSHITGAVFASGQWVVEVDLLLREGEAYTPIFVSNHRVARKNHRATALVVPTHRLGLSEPLEGPYKLRHHAVDGYGMALASRALADLGLDSGRAGLVGQDRDRVFLTDTDRFQPGLDAALAVPTPDGPRRVKECASCRFWEYCQPQLEAADEISLFLPGQRADAFREKGIHTIQGLIEANLGEPSQLARAWREGIPLLKRPGFEPVPRADVEVDVDMEAYLDQGAYLWGAWTDGSYHPFITWEPLGGRGEAENFAAFWAWLQGLRAEAHAAGKTFRAYCYSSHGENHWMTMSAQRFGTPSVKEVREFISSDEWVDVFAYVKRGFAGPFGLGLKLVAPQAGFHYDVDDFDGEESVMARKHGLAGDMEARERLLVYNADDVQATLAIREWMSAGATNVPPLDA